MAVYVDPLVGLDSDRPGAGAAAHGVVPPDRRHPRRTASLRLPAGAAPVLVPAPQRHPLALRHHRPQASPPCGWARWTSPVPRWAASSWPPHRGRSVSALAAPWPSAPPLHGWPQRPWNGWTVLDTYSCQGGAAVGYWLVGYDPSPASLFRFVQGDAVEFIRAHGHRFELVQASPPCQFGTKAQKIRKRGHPNGQDARRRQRRGQAPTRPGHHAITDRPRPPPHRRAPDHGLR